MWLREIRRLVKTEKPDVVLSFAARINVLVLLACLGIKQKIVVSERNDPYMDGRSKYIDWCTNWLYPKAHKVVFQTKRAQGYFKGLKNGEIITLYAHCKNIHVKEGEEIKQGQHIADVGSTRK